MCSGIKRIGGGSFGPHDRLFFKMLQNIFGLCVQPCINTLAFHLLASVLSLNIIESVIAFYVFSMVAQWWFRGLMAAADTYATWLDLPPPWPAEIVYHRFPRHHRKFGIYYKARLHAVLKFVWCSVLFSMVASCESMCMTPIHQLDFASDTPGWGSKSHTANSASAISPCVPPDTVSAFIDDWDPSTIVEIMNFGRMFHNRDEFYSQHHSYFTVLDTPTCYNTSTDSNTIIIVDSERDNRNF